MRTVSDENPYVPRSGQKVIEDLDQAGRGMHAAAFELSKLANEFYGDKGIGITYKIAVDEEKLSIWDDAIEHDRKPPPADIREAMAERRVRAKDPLRWAKYQSEKARIDALKLWMSNLKSSISACQSLRKEFGENL